MKYVLIALGMLALVGCTDATEAKRILKNEGYTDVQMTGYDFFACSEDDMFHTGFVGTNAAGNRVEGTICSGLFFKNSTIRYK
ncbi:hypothetical protein CPT_Muldoon_010 [Serratia phage Muldoon]|uniref:Lipoprotein n=1 Tax=Serratia phage Muldoon TaxID=2601678 RepID=A0A5P8PH04_9CAUD|nr:hypothetical protein HYP94_gp010 [Serratia phage Muldoon]QFR55967.1 hypothetical protein CPT_Muldoon_010 [Serratia phage Muldoon]